MNKMVETLLERIADWPEEAQAELMQSTNKSLRCSIATVHEGAVYRNRPPRSRRHFCLHCKSQCCSGCCGCRALRRTGWATERIPLYGSGDRYRGRAQVSARQVSVCCLLHGGAGRGRDSLHLTRGSAPSFICMKVRG